MPGTPPWPGCPELPPQLRNLQLKFGHLYCVAIRWGVVCPPIDGHHGRISRLGYKGGQIRWGPGKIRHTSGAGAGAIVDKMIVPDEFYRGAPITYGGTPELYF